VRVLHGPVNVGNQPYVLSRYERALGADSSLVVNYGTRFEYPADRVLASAGDSRSRRAARRLRFALTVPFRYDVLHYYFGRSFLTWDDAGGPNRLWHRDLKLAKALGRRVFMTFQGCDVRISRISSSSYDVTPCNLGYCNAAETCRALLDDRRQAMIREVLPSVDRAFVLNPELARYVPSADFLPYASVDLAAFEPEPPSPRKRLTIVHAPSDPSIKGSALIAAAVESLARRYPIDYRVVEGLPHAEALRLYRGADLVIDQVLAGWYGGLAVEAMAMAKPVACYLREEDLHVVPSEMRAEMPLVRVHPGSLETDLERAISEPQLLGELGEASRAYAWRWHDPRRIAAAMLRLYRDPTEPLVVS